MITAVAIGALALVIVMYRRVRAVSTLDRVVLAVMRLAAIALVLGCLLRPTTVVSSAVAQRNVLAILLDDSRSMRLRDVEGGARMEALRLGHARGRPPLA